MFNKIFNTTSRQTKFWDWFSNNQTIYFDFESNQDFLFSDLAKQLNKVDDNLTFEFSPVLDNGRRQLIISADGIKQGFPAVQNLVNDAPKFEKWEIIAFRQPHSNLTEIKLENFTLDFNNVYYRHAKDNDKLALELHIRNYEETNEFGMAIFLMLDTLLGEYDTEMMLSFIDKKVLDENMTNQLDPITDLPFLVEQHKKELFE